MTKAAFLWSDPDRWSKICLDHGASKEPVNPWPEWIYRFLWCDMIQTDLGSLIRIRITPKKRSLKSFPSVDSPSPCWISRTDLFKIRAFSASFISETKSVIPNLLRTPGTSNSLSHRSMNFKKFYRLESFLAYVLKQGYLNTHDRNLTQMSSCDVVHTELSPCVQLV